MSPYIKEAFCEMHTGRVTFYSKYIVKRELSDSSTMRYDYAIDTHARARGLMGPLRQLGEDKRVLYLRGAFSVL